MNIILIGFMGSGKSTVARILAKKMGRTHIETDAKIIALSGRKSINEIFSLDGELRFREMEIEIAKKLSSEKNIVLSTGGGMVMNKIGIDYLRINGRVIYLATSFSEIARRLKGDNTRPLFADRNKALKLYSFRKRLYEWYCDFTIDTDGKSADEVIDVILKSL